MALAYMIWEIQEEGVRYHTQILHISYILSTAGKDLGKISKAPGGG